jgi:SAM-dependent methyltransferase
LLLEQSFISANRYIICAMKFPPKTLFLLLSLTLFSGICYSQKSIKQTAKRKADVLYYPSTPETVEAMLKAANLQKDDVLYDLGSGDGRIPIKAATDYGVRAVGIEIDPKLVKESKEAANKAGVADKVSFREENFFRADLREATVVTLFLSESLNLSLKPKLLRELRPGSRIVSHDFPMGDWKADQVIKVPWLKDYSRTVYVWTVPQKKPINKKRRK